MEKIDLRSLLLSAEAADEIADAGPSARAASPKEMLNVTAPANAPGLPEGFENPIRAQLSDLVEARQDEPAAVAEIPSQFSSVLPSLLELKNDILKELET